jgi:spermidine synthase
VASWVYTIFFASGASALAFETLWFHQAGLTLGNSVWASSLVLAGFMAGLGLGNWIAARHGDRLTNPLRVYAIAELLIALTGVGLVWVLPNLGPVLTTLLRSGMDHTWLLQPLRLVLAFALLVIPATAMGVTLPLLVRALIGREPKFGALLGRLYGWNTLGAVAGVLVTEIVLIGALGIRGTALAAGALNLVAALVAATLSRSIPAPASLDRARAASAIPRTARPGLIAVFLSGFALLALEVVWFRFLSLFIESRSLAFALLLAVVLCGVALGGIAASIWLQRKSDARHPVSTVAFAAGALTMVGYAIFPFFRVHVADLGLAAPWFALCLALPLMLPVCFASGIFFTLIGAELRDIFSAESETTGHLTLANTLGAALGSLMGGFVLLPTLGMEGSLYVLAVVYGGIGALLVCRTRPRPVRMWLPGLALAVVAALFPFGAMERSHIAVPVAAMTNERDEVLAVREGLIDTLVYVAHRELGQPASYRMITNSYSMSANMWSARRYMDLYAVWPLALHPEPREALLISFGVGTTARALTTSSELTSIDVVDISRDVLEMGELIFAPGKYPLHDPRVRVHIEDGRHFLLTTERRFDLITGEPPPPQMAGVVNLYTREYFELMRDRLAPGGMVTYWLPLHSLSERAARSILRAFCDAFDDCSLWRGSGANLMMAATRNASGPVSRERLAAQWNDPDRVRELEAVGLEYPEQLGALFIGGADYVAALAGDVPPLVDNWPKRITAVDSGPEEAAAFARSIADVDAARDRFRESAWIENLWPESLREDSLAYFEWQRIVSRILTGELPLGRLHIDEADHLLRKSPLSIPVLWLLGSDSDKQRIVGEADERVRMHPQYQLHLGIEHLSKRRWRSAADALARAETLAQIETRAAALRTYALCRAGDLDDARELLRSQREKPGSDPTDDPVWRWLRAHYDIDPGDTQTAFAP